MKRRSPFLYFCKQYNCNGYIITALGGRKIFLQIRDAGSDKKNRNERNSFRHGADNGSRTHLFSLGS